MNSTDGKFDHGFRWSLFTIVLRNVLQLVSTTILARLLVPEHFGLISMANTMIAFLSFSADLGLSLATINRTNLTKIQLSNLFWINCLFGIILTFVAWGAAPLVAWFYNQPELSDIVAILGLQFLLIGLGTQPMALLKKELKFKSVYLIELFSVAISVFTAIGMAYSGYHYWSLVSIPLINWFVRTALSFPFAELKIHAPQFGQGTRPLLEFGGWVSLAGVFFYISRSLDDILIGKFLGTKEVAFYAKSYFFMEFPTQIAAGVAAVLIPTLSALQADKTKVTASYIKALRAFSFISAPISFSVGLLAPVVVPVFYGEQWLATIPLVQVIAFAGLLEPIYRLSGPVILTIGKGKVYFIWSLVCCLIFSTAFIIGLQYGTTGMVWAYLFASLLLITPISLFLTNHLIENHPLDTLKSMIPIYLCSLVAGLFGLVLYKTFKSLIDPKLLLAIIILLSISFYLFISYRLVKPFPLDSLRFWKK